MASTEQMDGEPVAAKIREEVSGRVRDLSEYVPTLGTVLMSDDPDDERFMELKHDACDDVGIATRECCLDPSAAESRLYHAVERLCADSEIDAVFVQSPLPDHVEMAGVRQRLDPQKDVDCFHPVNLGRLVAGNPRFLPATPAAVRRLLTAYDVTVEGQNVVIVGRSNTIGKPLANLFLNDAPLGNATVTVCHSHTTNLAAMTHRADIVVTACGVPELIDGSMLTSGVTVVDVSANRTESNGDIDVVGDVEYESARKVAAAITPVPGGVGPVTLAMLLKNVVCAAEQRNADTTN